MEHRPNILFLFSDQHRADALLDWMINTQNVPMPRGKKE